MNNGQIRRFVVLLVNAKTSPAEHLTQSPQGPGILSVGLASATTPMDNFSTDTVELMLRIVTDDEKAQQSIAGCNAKLAACVQPQPRPLPPCRVFAVVSSSCLSSDWNHRNATSCWAIPRASR